jgi:hypothetical protein
MSLLHYEGGNRLPPFFIVEFLESKSREKKVARPERLELPTLWFEARCSIQLSYGRCRRIIPSGEEFGW